MKYQSEIIHEILEQRGHEKSSLHYQSECIETWIEETKGAYPKLCDYESEWLNYIIENPIGEFPYVTLTDVTEATVDNVVPYAYKSAILNGQTTDTIINFTESFTIQNTVKDFNFLFSPKLNKNYMLTLELTDVTASKGESDYIAVRGVKEDGGYDQLAKLTQSYADGIYEIPCEFTKNYSNLRIAVSFKATIVNMKLRGDLISVKMPVLKTTGKNLYPHGDVDFEPASLNTWYMSNGEPQSKWGEALTHDCGNGKWFYLEGGKYSVSIGTSSTSTFQILGEGEAIKAIGDNMTYPSGWYTCRVKSNSDSLSRIQITNIQFEKSSKATEYKSYKSNIVTVNEDVTLRSNGNICDELNLLTGQLTQRIGEDGEVLSQEVVKTVELSITDESGNKINHFIPIEGTMHIQTDGEPIKPSVTMEIPVEAITQNLASFIEMEV